MPANPYSFLNGASEAELTCTPGLSNELMKLAPYSLHIYSRLMQRDAIDSRVHDNEEVGPCDVMGPTANHDLLLLMTLPPLYLTVAVGQYASMQLSLYLAAQDKLPNYKNWTNICRWPGDGPRRDSAERLNWMFDKHCQRCNYDESFCQFTIKFTLFKCLPSIHPGLLWYPRAPPRHQSVAQWPLPPAPPFPRRYRQPTCNCHPTTSPT